MCKNKHLTNPGYQTRTAVTLTYLPILQSGPLHYSKKNHNVMETVDTVVPSRHCKTLSTTLD